MQVHENEEDQAVSLATESWYVLSLIHTRDKKQEISRKYQNVHV